MSAMQPVRMVVMGVSGCGKSTVGLMLAQALGLPYVEGDDLHSPENVERMRSGTPLSDEQRRDWLEAISQRLAQAHAQAAGVVVSCSALKRAYRDVLRRGAPDLQLIHLHGTPDLLARRTAERVGHYMPASLLDSQLAILEPPGPDERAMAFDIADSPETVVVRILARLQQATAAASGA
ncbi:MAG: gluconokinase [Burkholderiaceae bacterium]